MSLAEWWCKRRARQTQKPPVSQPADVVSTRLNRIESRLTAMGVRVDHLEGGEERRRA